jgi:hypothetical protein
MMKHKHFSDSPVILSLHTIRYNIFFKYAQVVVTVPLFYSYYFLTYKENDGITNGKKEAIGFAISYASCEV